jgi:predicted DNA-binding protein (UPF0251 family)
MDRLETVILELDELEAMRLCDHEGLDQTEAGIRMEVSRGTVQRLLRSGRSKVLNALLSNAALVINQGESSGRGLGRHHGHGHHREDEER